TPSSSSACEPDHLDLPDLPWFEAPSRAWWSRRRVAGGSRARGESAMKRFFRLTLRRPLSWRQRVFAFLERSDRRRRWFKRTILLFTILVIAAILGAVPRGRYVVAALASEARVVALHSLGLPTPRSELDERWRRFRLQGIADSKRAHRRMFAEIDPAYRRLVSYAGLEPDHALVRWGDYDRALLLPPAVLQADG